LEPSDPVAARDVIIRSDGEEFPVLGLYSSEDLTKSQRTGTNGLALPFQRYWVQEIAEDVSESNEYTCSVTTTSFPPLPAYEPIPEPDEDRYTYAVEHIMITIDGGDPTYNPFLSDAEGKFVNIEFDTNWHARRIMCQIVAGEDATGGGIETWNKGTPVNVLLDREGYIPAGHVSLQWDGWWDAGDDTGYFAPDGDYAIEIRIEKYSNGAGFYCRAHEPIPGVESGSEDYITIAQDRDTVYGASPFTVTTDPTGVVSSPPIIYDTTNNGNGLEFNVTLACPAYVTIPIRVATKQRQTVPGNGGPKLSFVAQEWVLNFRENTRLLEAGSYTFYFTPYTDIMLNGEHLAFNWCDLAISGLHEASAQYAAWQLELRKGVQFMDKAMTVDEVHPTCGEFAWGGSDSSANKTLAYDSFGKYIWFVKWY